VNEESTQKFKIEVIVPGAVNLNDIRQALDTALTVPAKDEEQIKHNYAIEVDKVSEV
jgi:hypothetical protein